MVNLIFLASLVPRQEPWNAIERLSLSLSQLYSLKRDRNFKAEIYAQSGIVDYWVLDVSDRQLHVFREPSHNGYQNEIILSDDQTVSPLAFSNCPIAVREMLRPI